MAVCTVPPIYVIFNPSTLKTQYDSNAKKVMLFPDCSRYLSGGSCCNGNWGYISHLRFKIEGLYSCATDELIDELEGNYFCLGMEDPCEYLCRTANYHLSIYPTNGTVSLYIRDRVGLGAGNELYFKDTLPCDVLPMLFTNDFVIGNCEDPYNGYTVKGYGGIVKVS